MVNEYDGDGDEYEDKKRKRERGVCVQIFMCILHDSQMVERSTIRSC